MKKIFLILFLCLFSTFSFSEKIFWTIVNTSSKQIALSFDDGPGSNTIDVLKILKDNDIKATFFVLGESARKRPKTLKMIFDNGHEIGNHTYNHINFFRYKDIDKKEKIEEELLSTQNLVEEITGYKTNLVRFPNGYSREDALDIAKKNGYKVINWTYGIDWIKLYSSDELLEMYLNNVEPGAILLMHDLSKNIKLIEMLPKLITKLKEKGYSFLTVDELISSNN